MANIIAKSLHKSPCIVPFINRHSPMAIKSTKTNRYDRMNRDAPRLMHYDTMSVESALASDVKGKSILLYDDVFTWGNTSEAARYDIETCLCYYFHELPY